MIHFVWPWAFILLPLPWLIYKFFPPALAAEEAALWVPSLSPFAAVQHQREPEEREMAVAVGTLLLVLAGGCDRPSAVAG